MAAILFLRLAIFAWILPTRLGIFLAFWQVSVMHRRAIAQPAPLIQNLLGLSVMLLESPLTRHACRRRPDPKGGAERSGGDANSAHGRESIPPRAVIGTCQ
jgi:hypothetical protein